MAFTVKVNPCCPIIKLQVGDLDLTLENSPEMGKYMFGFSMNRSAEDSANDCVFKLYDETALLLEYALLQGYKNVHFQYGQDETNLSKKYSATIKDYNIEFTGGGHLILDLQVSVGADESSETSTEYSSNPGEAFLEVCEEEGWKVGTYVETKDTEKEAYLRTGQNATDFIKNTLIPDAVSVDGKNDYYFWTDTDGETGNTLANFAPKGDMIDVNGCKVYEIIIGGGIESEEKLQHEGVISFEPTFNGLFYNFFNEEGTAGLMQQQYGTQPGTGDGSGGGGYTGGSAGNLIWPCPSTQSISSKFGPRKAPTAGASTYHRGIDIPCPSGSDVVAAASGTVLVAKTGNNGGRGTYMFVDHGNGLGTLYQHLSSCLVSVGANVTSGQTIAKSGATGIGTGPHLHFEVHVGHTGSVSSSNAVNPEQYVSPGSTRTYSLRDLANQSRALEPGTGSKFIGYGWAKRDCGLYEGTSRDTKMIAKIFKGRKLTLMWETPAWYYVRYTQTLYGYILKESITLKDPGTGLDDVHNSIDQPTTTDTGTTDNNTTTMVTDAIANGGVSNPAYILEVPTVDEMTNVIIDPYTDNGLKRRIGSSTYNSTEMGRIAEYLWTKSQALANTAQLTLRGDASYEAMSFVVVIVLTPDGFFHHSSGLYQVLEISDDIDGGTYTTTLNMVKMGMNVNEDGTITVRDPSQMVFPIGTGSTGGVTTPGNGGSPLVGGGTINESALRGVCDKYNGCNYSQSARTGPNSYDCSSLVNAVMGDLGISVNWATTAVGVQKVGNGEWGQVVWKKGDGTLTVDKIASGDVFVYNNGSSNHTGIFVNSEQMFHASNPTKGVLYGSTSYYINYLNNYNGSRCYVVRPPASGGTPVQNNGIKSRIN